MAAGAHRDARWDPGAFLIALGVVLLVWLLRLTWRVRVSGVVPAPPMVLAYWHGDLLALVATPLGLRPTLLVSRSRDGSWAARAARWLGFDVMRGSSSRGAVSGGLALVRRLRRRLAVGLAVDGPRGPAQRAGSSATRLARCGGAPVIPVAADCRCALRLGSWDRLFVPAPFARVHIVIGPPMVGSELQLALDRVKRSAAQLARGAA